MECAGGVTNPCPATLPGVSSHLFLGLINTLMASQCALGPEGRYPSDYGPNLKDGDEFDFIVVGSGSAGSVVASRLSDIENWNVLLLEAGGYPSAMTEIPALLFSLQGTDEDWQYVMEPSTTGCLSMPDQSCACPRGKGLGGSSLLNAMTYIRGNRKDYDGWAEEGNPGWDYDTVTKHFKKIENLQGADSDEYGKDGDYDLSRYTCQQPVRQVLEKAYKELGYAKYRENKPLGSMDVISSISGGTRSNLAKSFLGKVKDRKNLHVALNAHVSRLLIDRETTIVKGVEVHINNKILRLKSRKEVVLSAGTINSPQILMNSGIGPREHLETLNIPVIKDLRVGENLQDHLLFPGIFVNVNKSATASKALMDELYNYFMYREGALSKVEITNFVAFVNQDKNALYPNVQFLHSFHSQNDQFFLPEIQRSFGTPSDVTALEIENNKKSDNVFILPTLLNPKSRGKVLLRNTDPFAQPMIYPNYFSDDGDEDINTMLQGIRIAEKLIETEAFSHVDPKLVIRDPANCKGFTHQSDDHWKCLLRNLATTVYHPVGTCKMGPQSDPAAVVDPRLKVYGVKGVRVIDGSIMPKITSCNTNAPIVMIGDKGAAMIKEDWLNKRDEL